MDQAILKITEMYDGYGTALYTLITVVISGFLSSIIGFEREIRGQSAGLRTHVLLAVGSCLMMSISIYAIRATDASFDSSRIAAGVVSGIGFLCAGCIIKIGSSVRGLTTSATLWICGGIGLAVGAGFILEAIITTAVALCFLLGLVEFEKILDKKAPQIHIIADYEIPILAIVHQKADDLNLIIKNIRSENDIDADGHKIVDLVVYFAYKSNKFSVDEFVEAISKVDKIYSVSKGKFIKNEK